MIPRQARTFNQLCSLKRDNWGTKTHWFMLDEISVTFAEQSSGESAKAMVSIPRKTFDKWVDAYNGVIPKRKKQNHARSS